MLASKQILEVANIFVDYQRVFPFLSEYFYSHEHFVPLFLPKIHCNNEHVVRMMIPSIPIPADSRHLEYKYQETQLCFCFLPFHLSLYS